MRLPPLRIGHGHDSHRLEEGRPLILGGVTVPFEMGLVGHSDADVLFHAVTDTLLGALALGDIGDWFPNTDPQWKGADSAVFLREAVSRKLLVPENQCRQGTQKEFSLFC